MAVIIEKNLLRGLFYAAAEGPLHGIVPISLRSEAKWNSGPAPSDPCECDRTWMPGVMAASSSLLFEYISFTQKCLQIST